MYTGSEAWSDSFCIPFVGMIRIRFYGYNLSRRHSAPRDSSLRCKVTNNISAMQIFFIKYRELRLLEYYSPQKCGE